MKFIDNGNVNTELIKPLFGNVKIKRITFHVNKEYLIEFDNGDSKWVSEEGGIK